MSLVFFFKLTVQGRTGMSRDIFHGRISQSSNNKHWIRSDFYGSIFSQCWAVTAHGLPITAQIWAVCIGRWAAKPGQNWGMIGFPGWPLNRGGISAIFGSSLWSGGRRGVTMLGCWKWKIYAAKILFFQNFHFLGNFDSLWLLTVDDVVLLGSVGVVAGEGASRGNKNVRLVLPPSAKYLNSETEEKLHFLLGVVDITVTCLRCSWWLICRAIAGLSLLLNGWKKKKELWYHPKCVWLFSFTHPLSLLVLPTPGEEMVLEKVVWPLSALNLGAFRDIIRAPPPPPFLLIFWPLEGAVTVSGDISDESNLFSPLDLLEPVKKEPMTDRMVIPKNWVLHFRSTYNILQ